MKQTLFTQTVFWLAAVAAFSSATARAQDEPKIELGFEQRVRNENWNNIFDWSDKTDDQRNQIRWRTRVWTQVPVSRYVDAAAGLVQETNEIIVPSTVNRFDEIAFEKLYLDFHNLPLKGLTLRVGRQDLMRGEGTVLLEGNPYDGSRSIYFNAAVLGYTVKKTKIELMGISDPSRDRYLPIIHNQHRLLTEWDEQALGAYVTNRSRKDTDIEAYYFFKKEFHDTRAATNAQFQPDRHLHAIGGRVVRRVGPGWSVVGEGGIERGRDHAARNIRAWSADGYLKRTLTAARMKPYLQAGYWAFSGNDPKTPGTVGGWDPLFARWPKWSEMYIYSQFREQGVAYLTNLAMSQLEAGFSPWKPVAWRFNYYHMNSFHPFAGNQQIFGAGTTRGDQLQTRLDFTVNANWRGHVLYEYHLPGDFYRGNDPGYFLRFEMIYTFRHLFPM